jgi:hypothetical protein
MMTHLVATYCLKTIENYYYYSNVLYIIILKDFVQDGQYFLFKYFIEYKVMQTIKIFLRVCVIPY